MHSIETALTLQICAAEFRPGPKDRFMRSHSKRSSRLDMFVLASGRLTKPHPPPRGGGGDWISSEYQALLEYRPLTSKKLRCFAGVYRLSPLPPTSRLYADVVTPTFRSLCLYLENLPLARMSADPRRALVRRRVDLLNMQQRNAA